MSNKPSDPPGRNWAPHVSRSVGAAQAMANERGRPPRLAAHVEKAIGAVQARMGETAASPQPLPSRSGGGGHVVQPALFASRSLDSSQSTYLTATAYWANGNQAEYNKSSDGNGHAEDNLIAALALQPAWPVQLFVSINRSPCTSTDRAGNGATTCNKGMGAEGCAERLIWLKGQMGVNGVMVVQYRDLYGGNANEEANSILANEAMVNAGIQIVTHQLGGPDPNQFRHTGAAKVF